VIISCKKNDSIPNDTFHLEMKVNGKNRSFAMCAGWPGGTGGGQFECVIISDTTLFIVAGCGGYASFLINSHEKINDGEYLLDSKNIAQVSTGNSAYNSYQTDLLHTGTLMIKKINTNRLQGTFSFVGVDTSGVIGVITKGSFLMPLTSY